MRIGFGLCVLGSLASTLFACTAILGDFTIVGDAPGTDAGGDNDAGTEDGSVDAGPDAAPPAPMVCSINGSEATIQVGTSPSERVAIHAFRRVGQDKRRVMWVSKTDDMLHFPTINQDLALPSISVLDVALGANPRTVLSWDGGFAAIGIAKTNQLVARRLDDAADVATDPVYLSAAGSVPQDLQDFSIAAAPVGGDNFFVVFTAKTGATTWGMQAGLFRIANGATAGTFQVAASNLSARPQIDSDSLVIDPAGGRALVFVSPDKGAGTTVIHELEIKTGKALVAPRPLPGARPGATLLPLVAQTDVGAGIDRVGLAFLDVDLTNDKLPILAYALAMPIANVASFKTSSLLAPVQFTDPGELAVDKGRSFWRHFVGGGSHVVEAARLTQSGAGVNFLWFDGTGTLRGKASGATALVKTDKVAGAAGVMVDAPNAFVANAAVAWTTDAGLIRVANVGCKKP